MSSSPWRTRALLSRVRASDQRELPSPRERERESAPCRAGAARRREAAVVRAERTSLREHGRGVGREIQRIWIIRVSDCFEKRSKVSRVSTLICGKRSFSGAKRRGSRVVRALDRHSSRPLCWKMHHFEFSRDRHVGSRRDLSALRHHRHGRAGGRAAFPTRARAERERERERAARDPQFARLLKFIIWRPKPSLFSRTLRFFGRKPSRAERKRSGHCRTAFLFAERVQETRSIGLSQLHLRVYDDAGAAPRRRAVRLHLRQLLPLHRRRVARGQLSLS